MKNLKEIYRKYWLGEAQSTLDLGKNIILCRLSGLIYSAKYRGELKKTKSYIEEKIKENKEKSVFLFANGPSLKDIDLGKISRLKKENYEVIALNSFVSRSAETLKPDYVVFADKIHFGLKEAASDQYAKDMDWCIDNDVKVFLPAHYAHLINLPQKLPFNAFSEVYSKNTSDITKPLGYYPLTALYALSIAKALGYKKILIAGFDNSYFKDFEVSQSSEVIINHKHYYDAEKDNTEVIQANTPTSKVFFDFYRQFKFIEKITGSCGLFENVSKKTYISTIKRNHSLDIYKETQVQLK